MVSYSFNSAIEILDSYSITDVLLPFFLIFVIIYATLSKTNILGTDKKNFNMIIALIMAITFVVPHITGNYMFDFDPVDVLNNSLAVIVTILVAVFAFFITIGSFGANSPKAGKVGGWVFGLAILFFINFAFPNIDFYLSIIIGLVSLWLVLSSGTGNEEDSSIVLSSVAFLALASIMYIFGSQMGFFSDLPPWLKDPIAQGFVILIAVASVVISFIMKE